MDQDRKEYRILHEPSYSALEVDLRPGQTIVADSGAMAWMDTSIRAATSTRGGLLQGIKRKILSGESFFVNTYRAEGRPGTVCFAPGSPGAIVAVELRGEDLLLEKGAFLCSDEGVRVDAKYQGLLRGFFNEGVFVLQCGGTGTLFFHGYGDIERIDIDGEYVVDNGFAVAWDPSLDYRLTRARRIRSFLFGDQLMLRYSGKGRLWVQSRSPQSLANWVHPFRRVRSRSSND